MSKRAIACGLCFLALSIQAQNVVTDTVEVNAHRLSKSEHAATPTQEINKAQIERMGITQVSDAVKHMAGVQVKDYGGIGGLKTISVRGLGAQHTAVMYDGVAISDCQTGQVDISRYSLDNVSNITLTIGQTDDIYQSAKQFASAGVLHINTDQAEHINKFSGVAGVRIGSYGLVNPTILLRTPLSSKLSLSAYVDYQRADGNYKFHMMNGDKSIDEKRNNSDIDAWRGEINLAYLPTNKQTLKLKAYLFDSNRGLPGNVIYDNTYAAERTYDRNYFGQLTYENRFSNKWKLNVNGKYNWSWSRYTDIDVATKTDDRYRQTEVYTNAVLWHQPIEGLSFSLAQDFGYNYLNTTQKYCVYPRRYTLLTAIASHYDNEWLSATASLLNTYITENVELGQAADDRHRLSPAVSLSFKPLRSTNWRLRISYKDIFRTPTFNDLYYTLLGNRSLSSEKTQQFNVGTLWNERFHGIINYANISVDAYIGRVEDKIVAIPKMFYWTMFNVGKVDTKGVDVTLNIEGQITKDINWYLMATYNYMHAWDVTDKQSAIWHNQLPYTPKHSGSGSVTLETPIVNLTYNLIWTGERYYMQQNTSSTKIDSYADHSISLFRAFNVGKIKFRVQADALNIGNKNYEVVRFYPMPGRNYRFSVKAEF